MRGGGMKLPNLQLARFNKGLTQEALAKLAEVSRSCISDLEAGVSRATAPTAKKLAEALGVEVHQLASNEGGDLHGTKAGG